MGAQLRSERSFKVRIDLRARLIPPISLTHLQQVLGATDLTYVIEESTNLVQWSPVSPVNQILTDNGFVQTIKAQVPRSDAVGGLLLLRLKVTHF